MASNMYARLVSEAASPAQAVVSLAIVDEEGAPVDITGSGSVTSASITDATAVGKSVLTAVDAPTARTAIGAGTSSVAVATTAPAALAAAAAVGVGTTAARADHVHAIPGASDGTVRGTVLRQAAFADLVADPTMANFNALLATLRSAGIIAA